MLWLWATIDLRNAVKTVRCWSLGNKNRFFLFFIFWKERKNNKTIGQNYMTLYHFGLSVRSWLIRSSLAVCSSDTFPCSCSTLMLVASLIVMVRGGLGLGLFLLGVSASLLAAPLRDPLDPTTRFQTPVWQGNKQGGVRFSRTEPHWGGPGRRVVQGSTLL